MQSKLVADAAISKQITETYFRGQLFFLRNKSDELINQLANAKPTRALEEKTQTAAKLAQRTRTDLKTLLLSYPDESRIIAARQDLANIVGQLLELEAALKE